MAGMTRHETRSELDREWVDVTFRWEHGMASFAMDVIGMEDEVVFTTDWDLRLWNNPNRSPALPLMALGFRR